MRRTPFTTEQNKALRETWAKENNPTTGQEILIAHETGLSKDQICRWFCNKRNQARTKGEVEVTKNGTKHPHVAARMWYAYRYDPEDFIAKLKAGKIDPATGKEIRLGERGMGGEKVVNGGEVNGGGQGKTKGGGEEDDENEEEENGDAEKEVSQPTILQKRKRDKSDEKQLESKLQKL